MIRYFACCLSFDENKDMRKKSILINYFDIYKILGELLNHYWSAYVEHNHKIYTRTIIRKIIFPHKSISQKVTKTAIIGHLESSQPLIDNMNKSVKQNELIRSIQPNLFGANWFFALFDIDYVWIHFVPNFGGVANTVSLITTKPPTNSAVVHWKLT